MQSKTLKSCNIISNPNCLYTTSDYYTIITSFVKGIDWVKTYGQLTDTCIKTNLATMLDEFNEMA